jgi:membrane-bound lytic murein transglycosylase A
MESLYKVCDGRKRTGRSYTIKFVPMSLSSPAVKVSRLPRVRVFFICTRIIALLCLFNLLDNEYTIANVIKTTTSELPSEFIDDADRSSLIKATEFQLRYLGKLPRDSIVTIGEDPYTIAWLIESLQDFIQIITHTASSKDLTRILQNKFTVYEASGRANAPAGEMLITGYYQPLFEGSLIKKPPFIYPLYTKPPSLYVQNDPKTGKDKIGRINSTGNLVPFWTRAEIDDQNVLAGNELVYLKDPVDAFFLQVQGSGQIRLRDNSLRSVHISASNGHEYRSIGKLLVDEKKITREDISMQTIRHYLREHPTEIKRILHHNRKFIFFRWEPGEPQGSLGQILTPGRSIAIDRKSLPVGAVAYIITQRPVINSDGVVTNWEPLQRFVLPQDSGAAIQGSGRADVFWGSGVYAETAAGLMKEKGRLFFLVKKNFRHDK